MERVYLGDWLYNAGIVGFLNINSHLWDVKDKKLISKDENLLKFGDNYIEFDRKIFDGFAERFFDYSSKEYMSLFNHIGKLKKLKETKLKELEISFNSKNEKEAKKVWKEITKSLKEIGLKDKYSYKEEIPESIASIEDANKILENAISYLENLPEEVKNKKAIDYFRFGKFFHRNWLNALSLESFKQKYEEPLKENSLKEQEIKVKKEKVKIPCFVCYPQRIAKKDKSFLTSLVSFAGLNADLINFIYMPKGRKIKSKIELPLCEICEIIYFSYFAGLTPVKKDNKTVYYFVNSDSSIEDLVRENQLLKNILTTEISENILLDFFTQIVLESSYREAVYTLQNIAVLELDLTNKTMPKVYSFNLSREKAQFLKEPKNKEDLRRFSRSYYKIKDTKISILPEIMYLILENKFYFNYLNKLLKFYTATQNNSKNYETNINPYQLQVLNSLIFRFLTHVGGLTMNTSEKEMWRIYNKGIELANLLKSKNAENKIQSISYNLLNALRIGDTREFMDVLIRTYMAYGEEIPSSFIKTLSDKETFYALGYSFLNGLLGEENQSKKQEEVDNNG